MTNCTNYRASRDFFFVNFWKQIKLNRCAVGRVKRFVAIDANLFIFIPFVKVVSEES